MDIDFENQLPLPSGNDGPGLACGDITEERVVSIVKSHIFQLQPSTSRPERLHIWVGGLVHCHAGVVVSQVDSPHDGPEAVCGEIGQSTRLLGALLFKASYSGGPCELSSTGDKVIKVHHAE